MIVLILWDTLSCMIDDIYNLRSEMAEALNMLNYAVCGSGSVYIVLDYIGQQGSKNYSFILGCNNFITNWKVLGEFLQPKRTKFVKVFFCQGLKTLWIIGGLRSLMWNASPFICHPRACWMNFLVNFCIVNSEQNMIALLWWTLGFLRALLDYSERIWA